MVAARKSKGQAPVAIEPVEVKARELLTQAIGLMNDALDLIYDQPLPIYKRLTLDVSIRPNAPDIGGTAVAAAIPCAAFRQPMLPARGSGPNPPRPPASERSPSGSCGTPSGRRTGSSRAARLPGRRQ
jgi:hypothetical protein